MKNTAILGTLTALFLFTPLSEAMGPLGAVSAPYPSCEETVTHGVLETTAALNHLADLVAEAEQGGPLEPVEVANGQWLAAWALAGDADELACGGFTPERDQVIDELMEQGHGFHHAEWQALSGRMEALGLELW